jgi:hypothetical protein
MIVSLSFHFSEKLGLAWSSFMEEQWEGLPALREMAEKIKDPNVEIPAYYYAPIHAYKDGKYTRMYAAYRIMLNRIPRTIFNRIPFTVCLGNLCWESALEEDLW